MCVYPFIFWVSENVMPGWLGGWLNDGMIDCLLGPVLSIYTFCSGFQISTTRIYFGHKITTTESTLSYRIFFSESVSYLSSNKDYLDRFMSLKGWGGGGGWGEGGKAGTGGS